VVLLIIWAPLILFSAFAVVAIWTAPPVERWKVAIMVLSLLRRGRLGDDSPANLGKPGAGKEAQERDR
jgi:hypothetical protein